MIEPDSRVCLAEHAPGTRSVPAVLDGPLRCAGQLIGVPAGRYDWLRFVVSSPSKALWPVWLYYAGGLDPEDFPVPAGQEVTTRLPVTRRDDLVGFRLPRVPGLVVHALTFVRPFRAGYPETAGAPIGLRTEVANP
jgi:hypothetical protein